VDDNYQDQRKKTHSRSVTYMARYVTYRENAVQKGLPYLPYARWVLGQRGPIVPFPELGEEDKPQPNEPDTPELQDD